MRNRQSLGLGQIGKAIQQTYGLSAQPTIKRVGPNFAIEFSPSDPNVHAHLNKINSSLHQLGSYPLGANGKLDTQNNKILLNAQELQQFCPSLANAQMHQAKPSSPRHTAAVSSAPHSKGAHAPKHTQSTPKGKGPLAQLESHLMSSKLFTNYRFNITWDDKGLLISPKQPFNRMQKQVLKNSGVPLDKNGNIHLSPNQIDTFLNNINYTGTKPNIRVKMPKINYVSSSPPTPTPNSALAARIADLYCNDPSNKAEHPNIKFTHKGIEIEFKDKGSMGNCLDHLKTHNVRYSGSFVDNKKITIPHDQVSKFLGPEVVFYKDPTRLPIGPSVPPSAPDPRANPWAKFDSGQQNALGKSHLFAKPNVVFVQTPPNDPNASPKIPRKGS